MQTDDYSRRAGIRSHDAPETDREAAGPEATDDDHPSLTRRGFLSGTAAGVGAVAAGAATTPVRAQEGSTRTVEMTDNLVFDPEEVAVTPGTTVVWENVGNIGHSVTAYEEDLPADAEFFASGGFETEDAARSAYSAGDPDSGDIAGGETYEYTFETEGTYPYFCIPHESAGMLGTIEVSEDAGATEGASGPVVPQVPDAAKTLGLAAAATLVATAGFAYVFLKYGGDYGVTR
ncbi:plastocyanin/azurin family copper-binding protein [Halobaculum rubrum]|uniref:plastocyanin/azurin family copper-binding protein n=1 Tax=Halobaculum rubrum TaxID=2872158 RepID=UPI001CA42246|nr:plastocyanin/azurin family copper-binding protein [Halobaculum rubrum]QZX99071.1 twin-arginine translocation signal domain-containing protein [Halobaculum rubrum]